MTDDPKALGLMAEASYRLRQRRLRAEQKGASAQPDELEAARVRKSTGALIEQAGTRAWADVALQMDDAARRVLSDSEAAAVVARVYPSLVRALALAFERESDVLPLKDAAAVLQITHEGLTKASNAGRLKLAIVRRGGRAYVRRADLDELTRPEQPAPDVLTRLLSEALGAALAPAREQSEPALTMTMREAAAALGITRSALFKRLDAGTAGLRPIHIGRHIRFSADAVRRAVATNQRKGT